MIRKVILFSAFFALSVAEEKHGGPAEHDKPEEHKPSPQPYDFAYESKGEHGAFHFRKESGDRHGRVSGSYGYKDEKGIQRIVEYIADENGYRAQVKTNEPGTDSKSPANVELHADPIVIEDTPKPQLEPQPVTDAVPVQPDDGSSQNID